VVSEIANRAKGSGESQDLQNARLNFTLGIIAGLADNAIADHEAVSKNLTVAGNGRESAPTKLQWVN
jgi:hypothetical protein